MLSFIKFAKRFFGVIIILVFFILVFSQGKVYEQKDLLYGVTFSQKQAQDLGLDWRQVYLEILDDLSARKLRLSAYWNEIEAEENNFYWDDLDWQIEEADKRGAEIILAVGGRLPRWPECHFPKWLNGYGEAEKNEKIKNYIEAVISRYKNKKNITAWQVENEPFLPHFGECPEPDSKKLDMEIALVKSLDSRPIVVTDSGELSIWVPAARRANIFGTTMYRDTYSEQLKSYIHYPIGPAFFRFKKNIARLFAKPDKWIVIELQAEPWAPVPFQNTSKTERDKTMNSEKFTEILEFARQTGFQEFYLWGVEWWYWEKETQNNPLLWEKAKKLFI